MDDICNATEHKIWWCHSLEICPCIKITCIGKRGKYNRKLKGAIKHVDICIPEFEIWCDGFPAKWTTGIFVHPKAGAVLAEDVTTWQLDRRYQLTSTNGTDRLCICIRGIDRVGGRGAIRERDAFTDELERERGRQREEKKYG